MNRTMRKSEMWKVWPVVAVPGFCATYCKSRMSAEWEQLKMEMASGVEWRITNPSVLY